MKELRTIADLDRALRDALGPVALFKHSTQCPISAGALEEVEAFLAANPAADLHYLDLIAHRDVSNEIAARLKVRHESPQAIVVRAGAAGAVLNHGEVTAEALGRALLA